MEPIPDSHAESSRPRAARIKSAIERFRQPSHSRAIWQLANTLIPYLCLWILMAWAMTVSYWLILPLALLAACLRVRIFIFMHDCGHGSFMRSKRANTLIGCLT